MATRMIASDTQRRQGPPQPKTGVSAAATAPKTTRTSQNCLCQAKRSSSLRIISSNTAWVLSVYQLS